MVELVEVLMLMAIVVDAHHSGTGWAVGHLLDGLMGQAGDECIDHGYVCLQVDVDGVDVAKAYSEYGSESEGLVFVEKVLDIGDGSSTVIDEPLKLTLSSCCFSIEAVSSWASYCVTKILEHDT